MTYPSGAVIHYNHGTANALDDIIGRPERLKEGTLTLESCSYLGMSTVVERMQNQSGIKLTYVTQSASTGDAGDPYTGLDRFGRVVDQRWYNTNTSADVDRYTYTYDRNSNRLTKANSLSSGFSETYGYDGLNRLTTTDRSGGSTGDQSWTLDALGNMASVSTNGGTPQSRTHNSQNQLTAMGGTSLTYDARGNVTTDDHGYTLIYDGWNRLIAVKNGATLLKAYTYDGLGRRITESDGTTTTHLYYTSSWQLIEERTGSGNGTARRQHVWSAGAGYVDALVLRDRDTDNNGSLDERLYVTQDANFNVTAIADTSGAVQERFAYNAYGAKQVLNATWGSTSDSKNWVVGHQGLFEDVTIGWHHNRHRIYSASMMRFGQQDPMGYIDGLNNYAALLLSPLKFNDALGLAATEVEFVRRRYLGPWKRMTGIVPGDSVGGSGGISAATFFPKIYFQRDYVELYKGCDCNGTPFVKYGSPLVAFGSAQSTAAADTGPGLDVGIPILIPIGYGKTGKIAKIELWKAWAPGFTPHFTSPPNEPDPPTIQFAPEGSGIWNSDFKLVRQISCDPAGTYWREPPLPKLP